MSITVAIYKVCILTSTVEQSWKPFWNLVDRDVALCPHVDPVFTAFSMVW